MNFKIKYVHVRIDDRDRRGSEDSLCFICASKAAVKANTDKEIIAIRTLDYEYEECYNCGTIIEDEITF